MALFKNPAEVIAEASMADMAASNILVESAADEFARECDSLSTLGADVVFYTEEVVPIFDAGNGVAVVEMDNLVKFMESSNIEDVGEAIDRLAEHYDIDPRNLGIVVEDADTIDDAISEAKVNAKHGDKKKLGVVAKAGDLIKDLKDKGVKIFKKGKKRK